MRQNYEFFHRSPSRVLHMHPSSTRPNCESRTSLVLLQFKHSPFKHVHAVRWYEILWLFKSVKSRFVHPFVCIYRGALQTVWQANNLSLLKWTDQVKALNQTTCAPIGRARWLDLEGRSQRFAWPLYFLHFLNSQCFRITTLIVDRLH